MAESWLHEKDTRLALQGTTSSENIELIVQVVYLVIDGTYKTGNTQKSFDVLDSILNQLKIYGISEESLYNDLIDQGVDANEINNGNYTDRKDFIQKWLLPSAIGENKHQYTHKGADYNYDSEKEDSSYWSGKDKHQSWMVKRKLLQDVVKNIFSVSPADAEKIAMTLYSIHCLRDLQCANVEDPKKREYLFDLPKGVVKYAYPLIKNNELLKNIRDNNDRLINSIERSKKANKWDDDLSAALENFLGAVEDGNGGLLSKVIPGFFH